MAPKYPEIKSIGAPPEKHADRVVGEMMQLIAKRQSDLWHTITKAIRNSSDGSPKAQRKMADRIKRAGALSTRLFPGKRGKYELHVYDFTGWDPSRDEEIMLGDPIPDRPWIACNVTIIESEGRGRRKLDHHTASFLFITHHAMSRAAQRHGLRTAQHLIDATLAIWNCTVDLMYEKGQDIFNPPPDGWRVPIDPNDPATIVVLKRHEELNSALIAATVFTRGETGDVPPATPKIRIPARRLDSSRQGRATGVPSADKRPAPTPSSLSPHGNAQALPLQGSGQPDAKDVQA